MVDGYQYESKLEANILGSLITNEGILVNNIRFLDEGCFYLDKHKKVFNVIKELFTENKQVDLISVTPSVNFPGTSGSELASQFDLLLSSISVLPTVPPPS